MPDITSSVECDVAALNSSAYSTGWRDSAVASYAGGTSTAGVCPAHSNTAGHIRISAGRGHSFYRYHLIFDTSGIDTAPLSVRADGAIPLYLKLNKDSAADMASLIGVKSTISVACGDSNSTAFYNDFEGWTAGSSWATTATNYTQMLTASLVAQAGTNVYITMSCTPQVAADIQDNDQVKFCIMEYYHDYLSGSTLSDPDNEFPDGNQTGNGAVVIHSHHGNNPSREPKITYSAGTTKSKVNGVHAGNSLRYAGVHRENTAKVGGTV